MSDWFCGDHGPEGVWKSEKGSALAPHIQMPDMGTNSEGGESSMTGRWDTNVIVTTGMTRGGGTLAK